MLRFELSGFEIAAPDEQDRLIPQRQFLVEVELGQDRQLGVFRAIEITDLEAFSLVEGHVRLVGVQDHSGTLVELRSTPQVAITNSSGRYRLRVAPGDATLVFRHPGYSLDTLTITALMPGETRVIDEILLDGEPASVRGVLSLARFGSPGRLRSLSISLRDRDNLGEMIQQTTPTDDGRFVLDNLPAGAYQLMIDGTGYQPIQRDFDLSVGQNLDLGQMVFQMTRWGVGQCLEGRVYLLLNGHMAVQKF